MKEKANIKNKNNQRRKLILGTGEISQEQKEYGFSGVDKNDWLNIFRVRNHVTVEMIEIYIKGKYGFETDEIGVTELQSTNSLKQFLIRVYFGRKDELYRTVFWPRGVGIRRFMLGVYEDKIGECNFL